MTKDSNSSSMKKEGHLLLSKTTDSLLPNEFTIKNAKLWYKRPPETWKTSGGRRKRMKSKNLRTPMKLEASLTQPKQSSVHLLEVKLLSKAKMAQLSSGTTMASILDGGNTSKTFSTKLWHSTRMLSTTSRHNPLTTLSVIYQPLKKSKELSKSWRTTRLLDSMVYLPRSTKFEMTCFSTNYIDFLSRFGQTKTYQQTLDTQQSLPST